MSDGPGGNRATRTSAWWYRVVNAPIDSFLGDGNLIARREVRDEMALGPPRSSRRGKGGTVAELVEPAGAARETVLAEAGWVRCSDGLVVQANVGAALLAGVHSPDQLIGQSLTGFLA